MTAIIFFIILSLVWSAQATYYISKAYKLYYVGAAESSTWYEAYNACYDRNMSLLTLENYEKLEDVHPILNNGKIFSKDQALRVWIGAIGNDRKFYWLANGAPLLATLWHPNNPSNSGGTENCVELWDDAVNDLTCTRKRGFVCEKRESYETISNGIFRSQNNNLILNFQAGK